MRWLIITVALVGAFILGLIIGYQHHPPKQHAAQCPTCQTIELNLNQPSQSTCQLQKVLHVNQSTKQAHKQPTESSESHKPKSQTAQPNKATTSVTSNNSQQQALNNSQLTSNRLARFQASIVTDLTKPYEPITTSTDANQDQSFWGIQLYKPTYVMPAYYTGSPYHAIYKNNTPDNQQVMSFEFKTQFSLLVPLASQIMDTPTSINFAYTQLSYWQVYAQSQYFRETDYEPELFVHHQFNNNWATNVGIVHQSNGRGGEFERSWNRAYAQLIFDYGHWSARIKPWVLIFQNESSDLHNPDIRDYLGNSRLELVYQNGRHQIALTSRNNLQSGFSHGMTQIQWSYRLWHYFYVYAQALSGYGQSLIEYDHYTNSAGLGIALNGL